MFDVRKLDACNRPNQLDSFGVLRDLPRPVHAVATMQTKTLPPPSTGSYEKSRDASLLRANVPQDTSVRLVALLTAQSSALQERQAALGAMLAEPMLTLPPSHTVVDQQLLKTARVAAELLEVAERTNERTRPASKGGRGKQSMRVLADACFEGILQIDAARHELSDSLDTESAYQRRQCLEALRRAQLVLTKIERLLARALAN